MEIVAEAIGIINDYMAQGFELTLRQLYYQFVSRDLLPNTVQSYKRLGDIINKARLAGLIDWEAIEDRTRNVEHPSHWESPQSILNVCARTYQRDLWMGQPYRVECWIEKEALAGVISDVCEEFRVPHFACRGYTSQSEMWDSAQRMIGYIEDGQQPLIIHLGDHDPSGIDMTRDIEDRMELFRAYHVEVKRIDVNRIALNYDQIEEYNPPPNPAKTTDARFASYAAEYGVESWELDALPPNVLTGLISDAIFAVRDHALWDEAKAIEDSERERIAQLAEDWDGGDGSPTPTKPKPDKPDDDDDEVEKDACDSCGTPCDFQDLEECKGCGASLCIDCSDFCAVEGKCVICEGNDEREA